jgi:hypothetical protein
MPDDEKMEFLGICPEGCALMHPTKWRENPQHVTRVFDGTTLSSRFDGGNLEEIEQSGYNSVNLFLTL